MRKEDLKAGVWFRQHVAIFDVINDGACYLREATYNYILLRHGDRMWFIPKDSLDILTDENGQITKIEQRVSRHYLGASMDDFDESRETQIHSYIYHQASGRSEYMRREEYDYYLINENCRDLPVINFDHHENPGWINYQAKKIKESFIDEDESFRKGFEFAITVAQQWLTDIIEEPGTRIIDAVTGEVTTKK